MVQIIRIRAKTEGLSVEDDALQALGELGNNTTLRSSVWPSFSKNTVFLNLLFLLIGMRFSCLRLLH